MTPSSRQYHYSLQHAAQASSTRKEIKLNSTRLLKRRQIKNSRPCAIATGKLFLRIVSTIKFRSIDELAADVEEIGERLIEAQPREKVVVNIVRRVLGIIRDEKAEGLKADARAQRKALAQRMKEDGEKIKTANSSDGEIQRPKSSPKSDTMSPAARARNVSASHSEASTALAHRPALMTSHTSYAVKNNAPQVHSLFNLLSSGRPSTEPTPTGLASLKEGGIDAAELRAKIAKSSRDSKAEVCEAVTEMVDELLQSDERIASYAPEHIHSNEVILTHTSSRTVQQFLLKAASKRKFTVIVAETYPNDSEETYSTLVGGLGPYEDEDEMPAEQFQKTLTQAGLTVVIISDAAVFALMSRVNKVILATHTVLANGGLVAASGARLIAKAAFKHRTPVIVVSGIYKLSPQYPYEFASMIEYGDADPVTNYDEGDLVEGVDVENPLFDYVPPELIKLYITNLYVFHLP